MFLAHHSGLWQSLGKLPETFYLNKNLLFKHGTTAEADTTIGQTQACLENQTDPQTD